MSNPIRYDYKSCELYIGLPQGWQFYITFRDDPKCNGINVIELVDPSGNHTDSCYNPTVCIFGPPFFLLNEALWIIDAVYRNLDQSGCTIPQIYAILLPITVSDLTDETTRTFIEQKYKCQLKGNIWNRISICPMNQSDDPELFPDDPLKINWDHEYPIEPRHVSSKNWSHLLPQPVNGLYDIPAFPDIESMYYSYRRINSEWMNDHNSSILHRFLNLMKS